MGCSLCTPGPDYEDNEISGVQSTSAVGSAKGLNFDLALQDVAKVEEQIYSKAFASFASGNAVPLDNVAMRDYIATNTALGWNDVDTKLLEKQDNMKISKTTFMQIMRQDACSEQLALERFVGLCGGGDSLTSSDCRTGLIMVKEELGIPDAVKDARWERVLDAVMRDSDMTISMENWLAHCNTMARIARAVQLAQL